MNRKSQKTHRSPYNSNYNENDSSSDIDSIIEQASETTALMDAHVAESHINSGLSTDKNPRKKRPKTSNNADQTTVSYGVCTFLNKICFYNYQCTNNT